VSFGTLLNPVAITERGDCSTVAPVVSASD